MPSSPTFTDYTRRHQRFFYKGVQLIPQDALVAGKQVYIRNMRSYQEGTLTVRYGAVVACATDLGAPGHSIFRLNDTTPAAAAPATRIIGAGGNLFRQVPGGAASLIAGGFSGNPLTAVAAAPVNSPQPFLYIADSVQHGKVDSGGTAYEIGLAPPRTTPTAELNEPQWTDLGQDMGTPGNWTSYGGASLPLAPDPLPVVDRVDTVITNILFDSGATGMASVALETFDNVVWGCFLDIGGGPERIIVQDILPPVAPCDIESIIYDVGASGLCTIQPTGSFSIGQTEAPSPAEIRKRYEQMGLPVPPRVSVTRTIDYPVNALVQLNGGEVVRILSATMGKDGVQSFRCFTSGTFAAGATITGIASFRTWFNTTAAVGDAVISKACQVEITPLSDDESEVGGCQAALATPDWLRIGDRAASPQDLVRMGIRVNLLGFVESVRILLNVDPHDPTLTKNYYFYEWRASDLIAAIQASAETATEQIATAQADAVEQGQVDSQYADQYGQASGGTVPIMQLPPDQADRNAGGSGGVGITVSKDGLVSIGAGLSRQLALGNDVWMTLECRVSDMSRVGTDTTMTLGALRSAAIFIQIFGTTEPVVVDISNPYIIGGYGPDVGPTLPPYVYRYRYRSTLTGERSNPSPTMRAGMTARRGLISVAGASSGAAQCDVIDWFRYGGTLARWAYVGTSPNSSPTFEDGMRDGEIDGGETLRVDLFQPWPTSDLPRTGTCDVTGTSVVRTGGDGFNTNWSADSLIIVNGKTTQLYASPTDSSRLEVVDNCGTGSGVEFSLPSPTLMGQPLPALWGGAINDVWFNFAVGDPTDPGAVHWSHGNDPDTTSDVNQLIISSASEPLQNGFMYDGIPFVFSTERLYRLVPTFGELTTFRSLETPCTRGLWSRWGMAVTPFGVFFIASDGIYLTEGGSEAVSVMDPDLRILFPQDGGQPETIRTMNPIDFTQAARMRLSWIHQTLYFDYVDTEGLNRTLLYEPLAQRWSFDIYPDSWAGVRVRLAEPGPQEYDHLMLTGESIVYEMSAEALTDNGEAVVWEVWTGWEHGDDPRATKQWGDAILDMNPGGSVDGITVIPVTINGNTEHPLNLLGVGIVVRDTFIVEVSSGIGVLSRNFGLKISGQCQICDTNRPLLYLWEPAWSFKQTTVARRATDWQDLGYKGAKFVQGVILRANTSNVAKSVQVQYDSPNASAVTALTLTVQHDGEQQVAYPKQAAGWAPFIAELVRLHTPDAVPWNLLDWRFVFEPAPEEATEWHTQDTTFDQPGFGTIRSGVLAYVSAVPTTLTIWHDLNPISYTLPSTAGVYQRVYASFEAAKGKAFRFRWTGEEPFRVFKRDCSVRWQPWGIPGGYQIVNPFGGPHRIDGAEV